jgi:hypothetical protein
MRPSPDELRRAVNEAMDFGKPTLINAVLDPAAGSEIGPHRQPQSAEQAEEEIVSSSARPRESGDPGPRTGFPLSRE